MLRKTNFETVPLAELTSKGLTPEDDQGPQIALIVDDEMVIANTLAAILKKSGFACMAAYSGEDALKMAAIVPPDLLLSDVAMPGMSGVDLAIAIKRSTPDCKVLLFSGHASAAGMLARARDAGYDFTILQKPLHPKELLAHISGTLGLPSREAAGARAVQSN